MKPTGDLESEIIAALPMRLALPAWMGMRQMESQAALVDGWCPFCRKRGFLAMPRWWHCNHCERTGNVIDFYMQIDGLDRPTVLRALVLKCVVGRLG